MKELYKLMAIFFVGVISLVSCTDESDFFEPEKEIETVTFKLGFQREADKEVVNSRATDDEKKLYDLHFYVFDSNDNLTGYKKIEYADGLIASSSPQEIQITAMTGESYIYAVANINKSTTYYLEESARNLLNVTDVASSNLKRSDLLAIKFKRRFGTEGSELFSPNPSDNIFIMSGYLNDGNKVTIQKDLSGNVSVAEGNGIVKLYRILAKNTLTIQSDVANGKFTPKYYRLCNVPKGGVLVPNAEISKVDTYTSNNITNEEVESSYRWNFGGDATISFYYPENLQVAKTNEKITSWKLRESNTWNNGVKTFSIAGDKAAYIEIHGDYEASSGQVTANVSYTVHFGDFSKTTSLDNFNVVRNYAYTYKVTVKGINDIEVEANREGNNPYAEGLIIDATSGKHYDVDAHYEARVMAFDKSNIVALKENGSGYILSIKTPFGETKETVNVKADGVYNMSGQKQCDLNDVSSLFTNEADYQWMKFVRNTTSNKIRTGADLSKDVCKYPGDNKEKGNWLNVFELLAELYDEGTYTDAGGSKAYYTCFIDENYYASKSWPQYVDKSQRSMLIANELAVSIDHKSLYAKVAYSISQRSISTFYVHSYQVNGRSVKAFGTEIIDEEKKYNSRFSNSTRGSFLDSDDWEARSSAVSTNQKKGWYDDIQTIEGVQPLYSTAAKACMSRNRDLDGDGSIDGDEVKWYLAAVDQYRALFFGQNALNQDAYLISNAEMADINNAYVSKGNDWDGDLNGHTYRSKYHYFTSSDGDKATFWPEEGLTNNPAGASGWVTEAQLVRCIRTLESGNNGLSDPERFYTYANNTFELGGIVATRNYTAEPLEVHNEVQEANNLFSSFVVAANDLKNTDGSYNFDLSDITGGSDPCTKYKDEPGTWRTPNQKEFALMNSNIPELAYDSNNNKLKYGTRTKFSGDDYGRDKRFWDWHNTHGIWSEGERINVGTGYENGVRIRCVRDK